MKRIELLLIDRNEEMAAAWESEFERSVMGEQPTPPEDLEKR